MDPRLQRILARRSRGILAEATASSSVDEVPVIAKVTDAAAWEQLSEVRASVRIGDQDPNDKTVIVTGRIPTTRIEAVRALGFVTSLKAARPLQPSLSAGTEETRARPSLLPAATSSNGGKDVVVGVIDYGCDFAHRNFLTAAGRTRLLSIWHQDGNNTPESPFGYGREITPDQINAALTQPNAYTPRSITGRNLTRPRRSERMARMCWTSVPATAPAQGLPALRLKLISCSSTSPMPISRSHAPKS